MTTSYWWIILALVVLFGVALFSRIRSARPSSERPPRSSGPVFPPVPPLKPGEKYDTPVKLVTLPNVPLAELWRQRLKEHGIETFLQGGSPLAGVYGTQLDAALPAELWVGEHNAERAAQLMRELG